MFAVEVALVYWVEGVRVRVMYPGVYSAGAAQATLWNHFYHRTLRHKLQLSVIEIHIK